MNSKPKPTDIEILQEARRREIKKLIDLYNDTISQNAQRIFDMGEANDRRRKQVAELEQELEGLRQ